MSLQSRFKFPSGIAHLLTIAIALAIVALMGVTTALDILRIRSIFRQELVQRGLTLATTLNDVMADPLYFSDVDDLDDLAQVVKGQTDIVFVHVFRPDGSLLVSTEQGDYPEGFVGGPFASDALRQSQTLHWERDQFLEFASPIQVGADTIGGVHFAFTTASIDGEVATLTRWRIIQSLVLVLIGTIIAYGLSRYFIKPLRVLASAARQIASGNLEFSTANQRNDEMGELAEAFTQMAASLKEAREERMIQHSALNRAYEQMRALSARLESVREEERATVARDIHDDEL